MRPEHWLFTIPLRLRSLFRWAQADQEVDDELRDHLERKTEEYVAQGMMSMTISVFPERFSRPGPERAKCIHERKVDRSTRWRP